jgi:hypothetical protein
LIDHDNLVVAPLNCSKRHSVAPLLLSALQADGY